MKKSLCIILAMLFAFAISAQNLNLKSGLKSEKAPWLQQDQPNQNSQSAEIIIPGELKNTDVVTCVDLGTSANAYGYGIGFSGGQGTCLHYNAELNSVVFIHNMGGDLDPGGYSGNIAYDISTDGGQNWSLMNILYAADDTAGGGYYLDAATYPQVGIYNAPGNTNPDNAFVAWEAGLVGSQSYDEIVYGRGNIGNTTDTTINYLNSNPGQNVFLSRANAFTLDNNGRMWIVNRNVDWDNGSLYWLEELVVTTCIWDNGQNDFVFEDQFVMDCPSEYPADIKIEFSPDGNFGYIAVLGNIEAMSGVDSESYYPIIWRTEDAGETWEGPIKVALAGEGGIVGVQYYLSNDELAGLYDPVPPRNEIPFTTAFDFDLTVDNYGNPHIAVVVGITGDDPYSIITDISQASGYMYTAAMLLSSDDLGSSGTWLGGIMGRPVSFRGTYGDFSEDNRIQISRAQNQLGGKVFVSWLDTDTTVSPENNAPDIWCRGVDVNSYLKTANENMEDRPNNVTFGSEATFSANFFTSSDEAIDDNSGFQTVPFVYLNLNMTDPAQPVQYKYIQDFTFSEWDYSYPAYLTVGQEEFGPLHKPGLAVSGLIPNPANDRVEIQITVHRPALTILTLTNLMGQTVKQINNFQMKTGSNNINLDISGLDSGIYFITIQAGGEKVSRKLVVE